ncbi:MAG: ATP-binding cassette domain-containing protein [Alistipes sp.]|nr:ATP-binding cassette domain-containing protein [Alistipes sp.]
MNLAMKGIVKSFGANDVLKSVDFHLNGGEICALLGENGAGKSTLMNILGGVLPADKGTIELDGRSVTFATPAQSLNAGIAFIHQSSSGEQHEAAHYKQSFHYSTFVSLLKVPSQGQRYCSEPTFRAKIFSSV